MSRGLQNKPPGTLITSSFLSNSMSQRFILIYLFYFGNAWRKKLWNASTITGLYNFPTTCYYSVSKLYKQYENFCNTWYQVCQKLKSSSLPVITTIKNDLRSTSGGTWNLLLIKSAKDIVGIMDIEKNIDLWYGFKDRRIDIL